VYKVSWQGLQNANLRLTALGWTMKNLVIPCLRALFSLAIVCVVPGDAQQAPQASSVTEQLARVAFASSESRTVPIDIFEINADGSGLRLLTPHHRPYWNWNCCPAWSPDGKEVAFVSWDVPTLRRSHGGVFVNELAGSNVRVLLRDDKICPQDIAWSPDGKLLVFARGPRLSDFLEGFHIIRPPACTRQQLFSINLVLTCLSKRIYISVQPIELRAWSTRRERPAGCKPR
jgi:hypothetical protein